MNKLLRVLWLMLCARFGARVSALGPCRTALRVWPHDLDLLWHMNNGVYLSLMDLGRLDMMLRSGAWRRFNEAGWYPVVVAETIQFRRSLNLFERFEIETRVLGWDEKAIVLEQQFFRGKESVAHALVRVRFLARQGGNVTPRELMEYLGETPESPALEGYAAAWNSLQGQWQGERPPQAS